MGIRFTPADLGDIDALSAVWEESTRLVWIETPTNPMLGIVDIAQVAEFAHENRALCVVDNTFATPYLQQPLSLGADAVVHSSTKYLGGHSDVVGGFAGTSDEQIAANLGFIQNAVGAVPAPFDCYMVQRGVKTLAVRMDRQCASAMAIADFLSGHPAVASVRYPGIRFSSRSQGRCATDAGVRGNGVVYLARGEAAALEVASRTEIFTLAESLGAVESLIEHPGRMTHLSVAGSPLSVDPALIRLSVGLEVLDDLLWDLERALD